MNESTSVTLTTTFDLNEVRPKNPELCSDEQFALFCKVFHEVQATDVDATALHAAIRESCSYYTEKGRYDLNGLKEDLVNLASCVDLLINGEEISKGKLTYEWVPLVIQVEDGEEETYYFEPLWFGNYQYACNNFDWNSPDINIDAQFMRFLMKLPSGRDRLKFLLELVEKLRDEGIAALQSKNEPLPVFDIEIVNFPKLHLKFGCTLAKDENASLMFRVYDNKDVGTFTIELEWDSGSNWPLLDFEIPHLIAAARSCDEALLMGSETAKPVNRLKIDRLGRAAA